MKYEVKGLLPFDSQRKLMSIIIKDPQGQYIMFSKGADSTMLDVIKATNAQKQEIQNKIDSYAEKYGYRTMVLAMRKFDGEMLRKYKTWQKESKEEDKDNRQNSKEMYEYLERKMQFLGATAVEDQVQWNAP